MLVICVKYPPFNWIIFKIVPAILCFRPLPWIPAIPRRFVILNLLCIVLADPAIFFPIQSNFIICIPVVSILQFLIYFIINDCWNILFIPHIFQDIQPFQRLWNYFSLRITSKPYTVPGYFSSWFHFGVSLYFWIFKYFFHIIWLLRCPDNIRWKNPKQQRQYHQNAYKLFSFFPHSASSCSFTIFLKK